MKRVQLNVAHGKATPQLRQLPAVFLATFALAFTPGALAGELVENGSFEVPQVPSDCGWATYFGQNGAALAADYCASNAMESHCVDAVLVPGWSAIWSDTLGITDEPGRIEIQNCSYNGCAAKVGQQKVELDSHHRYDNSSTGDNDIYLYQPLATCPRKPYVLNYWWKPRQAATADLDVWVEGLLLCQHRAPDGEPDWIGTTVYFVSDDLPGTELGFNACSCGDTFGPFLDGVSVTGPQQDDPGCYEPEPICGPRPNYLTMIYDGDPDGMDHHSQPPGEVQVETFTDEPLPATVQIKAYDWRGKFKNATRGNKTGIPNPPLFEGVVDRNLETFTIGPASGQKWLPPTTRFEIWSVGDELQEAELLQTVVFHTSCSQPLNVGDEFGAIVIWEGGRN